MSLTVKPVSGSKGIKAFIDFQHELYAGDAGYVPELYLAQKEMFDTKKYPFYEFGEVYPFMAYRDGKAVGRIVAIVNNRYNEFHKSNVGFFGFFDFVNNVEVAKALYHTAKEKLQSRGYDKLIGPTNFSTNETAGTLVFGYDDPPKVMMTYNKPYYDDIMKALGAEKEMDLHAFMIYSFEASDKSIKLAGLLEKRLEAQGITIRNLNVKDWKNEVVRVKQIYNLAWENNWGFVPFTDNEFKHLAEGLKLLVDEKFAYIAEHNGEPVGFSISLPNINEITQCFKKGRLLPFNIFKLLLRKKKVQSVRIAAAGVLEQYRKKGIEAIFFSKNILEARERNLIGGEASWILENNKDMMLAAEKLNGKLYKTYRLYSLPA